MNEGLEHESNGRVKVPTPIIYILIALVSGVTSAYASYTAGQSAMNARVSVLETRDAELERRLSSIEAKIDRLLLRERQ